MQIEEAIIRLLPIVDNDAYTDQFRDACKVAVDALKKQIPKKPYHDDAVGVPNGCPFCDTLVLPDEDFCPSCGQAIDWS